MPAPAPDRVNALQQGLDSERDKADELAVLIQQIRARATGLQKKAAGMTAAAATSKVHAARVADITLPQAPPLLPPPSSTATPTPAPSVAVTPVVQPHRGPPHGTAPLRTVHESPFEAEASEAHPPQTSPLVVSRPPPQRVLAAAPAAHPPSLPAVLHIEDAGVNGNGHGHAGASMPGPSVTPYHAQVLGYEDSTPASIGGPGGGGVASVARAPMGFGGGGGGGLTYHANEHEDDDIDNDVELRGSGHYTPTPCPTAEPGALAASLAEQFDAHEADGPASAPGAAGVEAAAGTHHFPMSLTSDTPLLSSGLWGNAPAAAPSHAHAHAQQQNPTSYRAEVEEAVFITPSGRAAASPPSTASAGGNPNSVLRGSVDGMWSQRQTHDLAPVVVEPAEVVVLGRVGVEAGALVSNPGSGTDAGRGVHSAAAATAASSADVASVDDEPPQPRASGPVPSPRGKLHRVHARQAAEQPRTYTSPSPPPDDVRGLRGAGRGHSEGELGLAHLLDDSIPTDYDATYDAVAPGTAGAAATGQRTPPAPVVEITQTRASPGGMSPGRRSRISLSPERSRSRAEWGGGASPRRYYDASSVDCRVAVAEANRDGVPGPYNSPPRLSRFDGLHQPRHFRQDRAPSPPSWNRSGGRGGSQRYRSPSRSASPATGHARSVTPTGAAPMPVGIVARGSSSSASPVRLVLEGSVGGTRGRPTRSPTRLSAGGRVTTPPRSRVTRDSRHAAATSPPRSGRLSPRPADPRAPGAEDPAVSLLRMGGTATRSQHTRASAPTSSASPLPDERERAAVRHPTRTPPTSPVKSPRSLPGSPASAAGGSQQVVALPAALRAASPPVSPEAGPRPPPHHQPPAPRASHDMGTQWEVASGPHSSPASLVHPRGSPVSRASSFKKSPPVHFAEPPASQRPRSPLSPRSPSVASFRSPPRSPLAHHDDGDVDTAAGHPPPLSLPSLPMGLPVDDACEVWCNVGGGAGTEGGKGKGTDDLSSEKKLAPSAPPSSVIKYPEKPEGAGGTGMVPLPLRGAASSTLRSKTSHDDPREPPRVPAPTQASSRCDESSFMAHGPPVNRTSRDSWGGAPVVGTVLPAAAASPPPPPPPARGAATNSMLEGQHARRVSPLRRSPVRRDVLDHSLAVSAGSWSAVGGHSQHQQQLHHPPSLGFAQPSTRDAFSAVPSPELTPLTPVDTTAGAAAPLSPGSPQSQLMGEPLIVEAELLAMQSEVGSVVAREGPGGVPHRVPAVHHDHDPDTTSGGMTLSATNEASHAHAHAHVPAHALPRSPTSPRSLYEAVSWTASGMDDAPAAPPPRSHSARGDGDDGGYAAAAAGRRPPPQRAGSTSAHTGAADPPSLKLFNREARGEAPGAQGHHVEEDDPSAHGQEHHTFDGSGRVRSVTAERRQQPQPRRTLQEAWEARAGTPTRHTSARAKNRRAAAVKSPARSVGRNAAAGGGGSAGASAASPTAGAKKRYAPPSSLATRDGPPRGRTMRVTGRDSTHTPPLRAGSSGGGRGPAPTASPPQRQRASGGPTSPSSRGRTLSPPLLTATPRVSGAARRTTMSPGGQESLASFAASPRVMLHTASCGAAGGPTYGGSAFGDSPAVSRSPSRSPARRRAASPAGSGARQRTEASPARERSRSPPKRVRTAGRLQQRPPPTRTRADGPWTGSGGVLPVAHGRGHGQDDWGVRGGEPRPMETHVGTELHPDADAGGNHHPARAWYPASPVVSPPPAAAPPQQLPSHPQWGGGDATAAAAAAAGVYSNSAPPQDLMGTATTTTSTTPPPVGGGRSYSPLEYAHGGVDGDQHYQDHGDPLRGSLKSNVARTASLPPHASPTTVTQQRGKHRRTLSGTLSPPRQQRHPRQPPYSPEDVASQETPSSGAGGSPERVWGALSGMQELYPPPEVMPPQRQHHSGSGSVTRRPPHHTPAAKPVAAAAAATANRSSSSSRRVRTPAAPPQEAAPAADAVGPINTAAVPVPAMLTPKELLEPFKTLGPFAATLLKEVIDFAGAVDDGSMRVDGGWASLAGAAGGGTATAGHRRLDKTHPHLPMLFKYKSALDAMLDQFRVNLLKLLEGQGMTECPFLPQAYRRRAENVVPANAPTPLRVVIHSPPDAGATHLLYSCVQVAVNTYVLPNWYDNRTMVLPVNWTTLLPSGLAEGVDLGLVFCRLVQHTLQCVAVFRPEVRPHLAALTSYFKRLVAQAHPPGFPVALEGEWEGCRTLSKTLQAAYHGGQPQLTLFLRGMCVLPFVIADALGLRHVVCAYANFDVVNDTLFTFRGTAVPGSGVVAAVTNALSQCNASVFLALRHETELEVSALWLPLSLDGLASATDLAEAHVPALEIPRVLAASRGVPAYAARLLHAETRVALLNKASSEYEERQRRLTFLRDAATVIMDKIAALADEGAAPVPSPPPQQQLKHR